MLKPGGDFEWVTALARRPLAPNSPPLDLGLRASPKEPGAGHATLYLGTTQVLGVRCRRDGRFKLTPHQSGGLFEAVDPPFDPTWERWQLLADLVAAMSQIERHVHSAIAAAPKGRQVEGLYQAALAKPSGAGFVLVDREVQLVFDNDDDRRAWKDVWRVPLTAAQAAMASGHPWAAKAESPGHKLDALAVDRDGRLLAIEVKPGQAARTLVWTPVQVAMYARMMRAWTAADHDHAREVIEGMASQRAGLDLGPALVQSVRTPIEVIPVIAVGLPVPDRALAAERFALVRDALHLAGESLDDLQIWAINGDGRIVITDATELDQRFG